MEYKFNEQFLWGAASSGPQSEGKEGKAAESMWEYDSARQPEKYFNGVNSFMTSDFYNKYEEYIKLMKEVGLNSYRTSIQWSRVINDCDGTVNPDGVAFYHKVIDELIANGIEPMICLFHFDMPMYWMEKGGFENRETLQAYVEYAALCFKEYGSKVHYWTTFNEPVVIPEQGYLYKVHYPEVSDMKRAVQVGFHIQLASSMAIERFREMGCSGEIGIILNLTPSYAPENATKEDLEACELADMLFNRSFLDPSAKGSYPNQLVEFLKRENILPEYEARDLECILHNRIDYLGVNYYSPRRIKARTGEYTADHMLPETFFENYTFEGQKMNPYRGWEIYEKAVYDIAINIRDHYDNIRWYISENGMGVEAEERFADENGIIQDNYRIDFIKDHLRYLHKGIAEGSNCFGYHLWAAYDNWSWRNAYKNRYGLIRVDINHNCQLTIKKSGRWYRALSEANGFED